MLAYICTLLLSPEAASLFFATLLRKPEAIKRRRLRFFASYLGYA
jgi:hypothetical protein